MSAPALTSLQQICPQIRQLGEHLVPYTSLLDPETVAFVRNASTEIVKCLAELPAQSDVDLENQEIRHHLRNKIAGVRGSCELILMDLPPSHAVVPAVKQMIIFSDQVVAVLNSVRGRLGS